MLEHGVPVVNLTMNSKSFWRETAFRCVTCRGRASQLAMWGFQSSSDSARRGETKKKFLLSKRERLPLYHLRSLIVSQLGVFETGGASGFRETIEFLLGHEAFLSHQRQKCRRITDCRPKTRTGRQRVRLEEKRKRVSHTW